VSAPGSAVASNETQLVAKVDMNFFAKDTGDI
jgi:hypothetical protein